MFETLPFEILQGDAAEIAPTLPVVDCIVTSPPYFNQRQYGNDGRELGQEALVEDYVVFLTKILTSVPLAPWGSIWVNIGDKRGEDHELLCVPELFVGFMRSKGYHLIDKVVWAKQVVKVDGTAIGHCMVEPAPGRLNGNGYEPFYHFARPNRKMWSDMCAVNIPREHVENTRYKSKSLMKCETSIEGRRLTNVWNVPMSGRGKGHFAPFPVALVERPIAMSCPEWVTAKGPRERIIEKVEYDEQKTSKRVFGQYSQTEEGFMTQDELTEKAGRQDAGRKYIARHAVHKGWTNESLPAVPGIVLDPFVGTGTTGEAAIKLGRRFIGIDLYQEFADRSRERCEMAFSSIPAVSQESEVERYAPAEPCSSTE